MRTLTSKSKHYSNVYVRMNTNSKYDWTKK